MTKQYFGTDGIRGKVGEYPITAEFMLRLGWAAGRVFSREARGTIVIGKDTRVSGYMFESALEAGLVSAGIDVLLLGPMPTPAVAYLTRTFNASAGIVISASHNPYYDNGIKFFSGTGEKLDDAVELAIEAELKACESAPLSMVPSDKIGRVSRIDDAPGRYIEFCKSSVQPDFTLRGMKIVLDCAHGATYHVAPGVFRELGAEIIELGAEPDGFNINEEVGSTSPAMLQETVLKEGAHLGIAFDGDGDRVIMVDEAGSVVDGDELLYIIAAFRRSEGSLKGGVVGTQMSNFGLETALADNQIEFRRTAVGDRHVLAELRTQEWDLGGESSGHILCLDVASTGDGIIAALQVLYAIRRRELSLGSARSGMEKYPQHMINVACARGTDFSSPAITHAISEAEEVLGGNGRVLLRASGTEPVVRVMVEGRDSSLVRGLAEQLAEKVTQQLG